MARREQDMLPSRKKKPQHTSRPPEPLAKSGATFLSAVSNKDDNQKDIYSKPIFKTRKFDLF